MSTPPAPPAPAHHTSSRAVLLVDDDPLVLDTMAYFFAARGWTVTRATDGRMGVEAYERERPDLVLLDIAMPGLSGMQILQVLMHRDPDATVVMLTAHGDVATAVDALHLGAENFLTKPVSLDHLEMVAERAYEKSELRRRNRYFAGKQLDQASLDSLGRSPAMLELAAQVELLAVGTAPILLTGETGTGKGWMAKLIHAASPRARAPFVAVNCAGLTATFLDTELFGHEKGAFTDAKTQKPGLFEIANGGTLFLDEIGDLAPELQPKLLTVLETQRFRRLGGTREIEVDVRLIAATHHDLADAVKAGRFRQDLYYRLAVLPLRLPPIRERGRDEIADLAIRLLGDLQRRLGRGPTRISANALARLVRHPWPGNIRELRNTLERALLLAGPCEQLGPEHLPGELRPAPDMPEEPLPDDLSLTSVERRHITRVITMVGGNRLHAAKVLGIARHTLYKRLREYGIEHLGRT
jgi:DNA-binding NtrC family response regulator